ncbi:DNA polymerase III, alpha subunit [Streptococcus criceti]|uniref:DNA polymerase III polC-type n=1 Tax=Streptococcus criceti HS-6 TaxID=873449 RepID=G5JNM4_STRCG|nr:3'-5' exonuclease [Streptococcus criceti]EHI73886.1 DNA polymerase III, epsilon subunit family protein [Streptococcus criceti HS-6]SUN43282.1 DNA polymerase III, alpha subunit [Streptococcus criceti]
MVKQLKRPHKGQSLLLGLADYTVVDIETTGMSGAAAKIIEISAIQVRQHQPVAEFSMLINPHQKLTYFIKQLTGITDAMLDRAPEIEEVLAQFKDFLGQDVIVGHNVHFDVNFLYDNFLHYRKEYLTNDFVDTLRLSRKYLDLSRNRLDDLIDYYGFAKRDKHRALNDCLLTQQVYEVLAKQITK